MTVASATRMDIPRDDLGLDFWLGNFAAAIGEDPAAAGVTADEAAELAALSESYSAALQLAIRPGTRSADTIALKDAARDRAVGTQALTGTGPTPTAAPAGPGRPPRRRR